MKKLLFVAASYGNAHRNAKHDRIVTKAEKQGHSTSWQGYLHGKVEAHFGFDMGTFLNVEGIIDHHNTSYKDLDIKVLKDGIYRVKVIGYKNPCAAFIWERPYDDRTNCLIVDINDKESLKDALQKYLEKRYCI